MGIFDWKHWIVILVVVVLVFGTKKLKNLGTDVGESIKGFRKAMNDDENPPTRPPTRCLRRSLCTRRPPSRSPSVAPSTCRLRKSKSRPAKTREH